MLSTPADAEALRRQARARRGPVVYAVEQAVWSRDDSVVVAAMSRLTHFMAELCTNAFFLQVRVFFLFFLPPGEGGVDESSLIYLPNFCLI